MDKKYEVGIIKKYQETDGNVFPYGTSSNPFINRNFIVETESGKEVVVYSDGLQYKTGSKVYIESISEPNGLSSFFLNEKIRTLEIFGSMALFSIVVLVVFGVKGLKSLFSLCLSLLIIFFVLLPLTLNGYNPILVASITSFLLLVTMILVSHGRNKISYSAIIGCGISILFTIFISYIVVISSSITGATNDSYSYLNNFLNLNLDFTLLAISAVIIGVIGAIDDGAITQASVVNQLKIANPKLSDIEYYKRAMHVGRDHAGSMINTLVLAYVGSSLPLLLTIYTSPIPLKILLNQEIIAIEIFKSTIGSVGLLLAIPLTTFFATKLIKTPVINHEHHHH